MFRTMHPARPTRCAAIVSCMLCAATVQARTPTGWTTGGKSVLILRVAFTDNAAPADPPGGWTNVMNEVNAFYQHGSYGKAWIGSFVVAPVVNMGVPATNYLPLTDWKTSAFLPDIRAKAKLAGYDTDDFDLEVVQTRITNTTAGSAGIAIHGGKGVWLNYTNGFAKFTYATAHEFGHNFGLFHTRGFSAPNYDVFPIARNGLWWDEYGGMFDCMGGSALSPVADFCAFDKFFLGWLDGPQVAQPATSGTFRIHALDQGAMAATNFAALKFARDPHNNYWFEFRQLHTNNAWAMNGLLAYWGGEDMLASGGSPMQLDMTPASRGLNDPDPSRTPGATLHDGALEIGRTFADANANFFITPLRKAGTTPEALDVVVNIGTFPSNRPPLVSLAVTNAVPATNQLVAFSISATDPDGDALAYYWEFDDPAASAGAGVVPFGIAGGGFDATIATNSSYVWTTGGVFQVRCTVTDMKGGRTTASALVTVGGGGNALTISGVVRDESGNPIEGAVVSNWKPAAPNAALFGTTNLFASAGTASNGQFIIRVRPNTTNHLRAYAGGRIFSTNAPLIAQTAVVAVANASISNLVFTRVTNLLTISGQVLLSGNTRSYNPLTDGAMTVTELRTGQSTNVGTNGIWQMSVRGGPVELSFASASNHPVRLGFPNPYELNENFNLFTVFADVPGAVSSQGFGTSVMVGDGQATNLAIPVVLTPPAGWTNESWFAATWIGGFVDERSTAAYGVDYRLDGMEINFTNSTPVFTNFITLHVLASGATNSRLIVLHLEGFNAGANIGANRNFTYAIIPPAADADGDSLPDWWEWRFSQSLTNLAASTDPDGDGADNLAEYLADTEPFNAASRLTLDGAALQADGLRLDWTGGTAAVQFIEGSSDLGGIGAWQVLYTNTPPAASTSNRVFIATNVAGFFRIRATR